MLCRGPALFLLFASLVACGQNPLNPRDPTPGMFHLEVQSYNVELHHSSDQATVQAVASEDADVVSLQEITPEWEVVLRDRYAQQYPHMLFRPAQSGGGGLAVLSRFPLDDLGFHKGPNGWHPAWHVSVETPAGLLQVLNVHLRAPLRGRDGRIESFLETGEDHLYSIEQFTGQCATELPTLVVGDFNEDVDGEAIRFLEDLGFRNALPLYHPGQGTWRYRSIGDQFSKTYDHILFDGNFDVLNAWVERDGNSDHLPVFAHLELLPES